MSNLKINLTVEYTSLPAHCKIFFNDQLIFDNVLKTNMTLDHEFEPTDKKIRLKIIKTGKTKDIVDKNHDQIINIEKVFINNIEVKIKEFGLCSARNNSYVKDHVLQTTNLTLNCEWSITLLSQNFIGNFDSEQKKLLLRDKITDTDIACFGCSNTYGYCLESTQSWPYQLGKKLNLKVGNYGIPGSNVSEITAFVNYYLKNYNTDLILLLLPHSMRRQVNENGKIKNIPSLDSRNKDYIFHGEHHSMINLSVFMEAWLRKKNKTNILLGLYHESEYKLLEKTPIKHYLIPFLDYKQYPLARDGLHFGEKYCELYAECVVEHIKNKKLLS